MKVWMPVDLLYDLPENMEEETKDSKISLMSTNKFTNSFILKIPNYFTLPEYEDASFDMRSPSFQFANATWCFRFQSNKKDITDDGNIIIEFLIKIIRLNFEMPKQRLFYIIMLLGANDEEYQRLCDNDIFIDENNERIMIFAVNDKLLYDKRDTLTLIINLFHFDLTEVGRDQVTLATERGVKLLSQDMKDVLVNGQDYNVTFNVKDKEFRAHQDILRARSEVFRGMLSHDMLEKNRGVIEVLDCDPGAFGLFLHYVYTGEIMTLDENTMLDLYYIADKYNMLHLKEKCSEFIKKSLSVTNVCYALHLALKHNDGKLLDSVTRFFNNNVSDIIDTVEWRTFMNEHPDQVNELILKSVTKSKVTSIL